MFGSVTLVAMDWLIMNVAPEWIVVGSVGLAFILMGILLLVLERATRAPVERDRYCGSRRSGRAAGAEPYSAHRRGLRVAPYVAPGYLETLGAPDARHRRSEPGITRDLARPWAPLRREHL